MRLLLTIVLNLVIVLLVGILIFVGYMVYTAYSEDEGAHISEFIDPAYLFSLVRIGQNDEWKVYESNTYSFEHPSAWRPIRKNTSQSGTAEITDLKIPVMFSLPRLGTITIIGYYRDALLEIRPPQTIDEQPIIFAERQGYRWIYKTGENNFMYMYAIALSNDQINFRQASSFVLMVESVRRDKDLEEILDRVVHSVKFK